MDSAVGRSGEVKMCNAFVHIKSRLALRFFMRGLHQIHAKIGQGYVKEKEALIKGKMRG